MTIAGTVAGVLGTLSSLPQTIKVYRSGRSDDVSWAMIVMWLGATVLWFVHAVQRSDGILMFWNAVATVLVSVLAYAKFSTGPRQSSHSTR
jgi:uncharacterized protein with PQ loop repeat